MGAESPLPPDIHMRCDQEPDDCEDCQWLSEDYYHGERPECQDGSCDCDYEARGREGALKAPES